ncbi:nicotinate phosphoribosyltransferase [Guggenheimella bovis]
MNNLAFGHNNSMLVDLYELTMSNGYFQHGMKDLVVYFDMFYRNNPDDGGFAISCGLEQLLEYIEELEFTEEDIDYLRSVGIDDENFLDYLRDFKFTGDVWAIPEGTPVFPREPMVTVRAPIIEAQILETMLLLIISHQTLIASKANRLVRAAQGKPIVEFGARRAQGKDAATKGARAAYIGGVIGTSNLMAGERYGIPVYGTMAHSWIQIFDDEYQAFKAYCEVYPDNVSLLVDTYNTLKSGIPNAIKVFNEVVLPSGHRPKSVRLDSGDLAFLSKEVRKMLDEAGFEDVKIMASNSINEETLKDLRDQGAKIDSYGIGENLITSSSDAVLGGVYKLVAVEHEGMIEPKIKISENIGKITVPGFKQVYRIYDNKTGKALADYMTLRDEVIDTSKPLEIFDPIYTWKRQTLENFSVQELLVPVIRNGKRVYPKLEINEINEHRIKEEERLWDGVKRVQNPHRYFVDLSQKLWDVQRDLLDRLAHRGR